jgi:hypothetical protein
VSPNGSVDNRQALATSPLDLHALRYEPLDERPSKISLADQGRPRPGELWFADWLDSLPRVLGADALRRLCDAIVRSCGAGRPVVAALGGHVVKTGCGIYLVDWVNRGILTGLALNGSAAIHDLELAIAGKTSEDVGSRLMQGKFGFARETSDLFALACKRAGAKSTGLGAALGDIILEYGGPGLDSSLLVAARRASVPLSVHVAIGTDIVHMSPILDGAAMGKAALDDFRSLCGVVAGMSAGVWLNIGSAVVMPEVFLKAVSIARNLGHSLDGMTTANLDFDQKYRGMLNVLERPGAQGIALTGHHEILIPLLHAAVSSRIARTKHEGSSKLSSAPVASGEAR